MLKFNIYHREAKLRDFADAMLPTLSNGVVIL